MDISVVHLKKISFKSSIYTMIHVNPTSNTKCYMYLSTTGDALCIVFFFFNKTPFIPRRAETHNLEVHCEVLSPRPRSAAGGADEVSLLLSLRRAYLLFELYICM